MLTPSFFSETVPAYLPFSMTCSKNGQSDSNSVMLLHMLKGLGQTGIPNQLCLYRTFPLFLHLLLLGIFDIICNFLCMAKMNIKGP